MLREIFTVTNANSHHHTLLIIKLGLLFIYILSIKCQVGHIKSNNRYCLIQFQPFDIKLVTFQFNSLILKIGGQ